MKQRIVPESNYRSFWLNSGKTFRSAINPKQPVTELKQPEFYDIKITDTCTGGCPYCYQNSTRMAKPYEYVTEKLRKFFSSIPKDQRPFQIAYGGGEPTLSPEFEDIIRMTKEEFDITSNFTTNGIWIGNTEEWRNKHLQLVKQFCGGVAVSTHPHLARQWNQAAIEYTDWNIRTNLHCIISDEESVDTFLTTFYRLKDRIEYFVLLPYGNQGRAEKNPRDIAWEYLVDNFPTSPWNKEKIAWGANFYPYLKQRDLDVKISLYEPEIFSKYIDCKDNGYLYASSFSNVILDQGFLAL